MIEAVLAYLRAGFTVVPLCWPVDGTCGAGHRDCRDNPRNIGKVPLFVEGRVPVFGPGDEEEAKAFWERTPNANIGIRLEESGLLVVDVDALDDLPPDLRQTIEGYEHYVRSGRGRHLYFWRGDAPARNVKLDGWEVRGRGYVVAPPSLHRTGTAYRWSQDTFTVYPDLPAFVREALAKVEASFVEVEIDWDHLPDVDISRIPLSIETRELIRFGAPKGARSEAIWRVIGDLIRAGCDDATVAAVLMNPEHLISEKIREKAPEQQRKYVEYQIAKMRAEIQSNPPEPEPETPPPPPVQSPNAGVKTAKEIWHTDYPEPKWLVEGILTEGLTILGGRSKIGKSWLVLDLALSVALGRPVWGGVPTEPAGVLYISLEDTERRIKSRMASVLKGDEPPEALHIATVWPRAMERDPQGRSKEYQPAGIKKLYWFLKERPAIKLVIIDTFAKFRTLWDRQQDIYQRDYVDVGLLKEMADMLGVAVLLVHHHRKGSADDIGEALNGSVGLPGAADTVWSLTRKGARGTLSVTGRDVEEKAYVLDFMEGYWVLRGEEKEAQETQEEMEVVAVIEDRGEVTPAVLAEELGITVDAAKKRLQRMTQRGLVQRLGRGRYCLAGETALNSVQEER